MRGRVGFTSGMVLSAPHSLRAGGSRGSTREGRHPEPGRLRPEDHAQAARPRLETLEGKTIYLVDCRFDDSDVFLKQMQAWFAERMPGVRTVFKPISSVYLHDDPTTWQEIKAKGHAAIIGVGH